MKQCTKCGQWLSEDFFHRDKNKKDGLRYWCKDCVAENNKQYRKDNAKKAKEYNKQYRKDNAEKIKEQQRQYRKDNAEKIREWRRQYQKDNAEKVKERDRQYYKDNAEKINERNRQYQKDNAEKLKERKKQHYKDNAEKINEQQRQYRKDNAEKVKKQKRQYYKDNAEKLNEQKRQYYKDNASYDTYAPQLDFAEQVRKSKRGYLEAKCAYCGKWFKPTNQEVNGRINALNGRTGGEHRLYCSKGCKSECPIFGQIKYPKNHKKYKASSREVQPELRQMVFERDNWTCTKCGKKRSLHCHHVEGIHYEPLESADIDRCITVCKQCHVAIHKVPSCRYVDLQCEKA